MAKEKNIVRKHLSSRELKKLQKNHGDKHGVIHDLFHDGLEVGVYLLIGFLFIQFTKGYLNSAASAVSNYAQSLL